MKFAPAKNSLFGILLRKHWGAAACLGVAISAGAAALMPSNLKLVGALMGLPLFVISAMAARIQWRLPSPEQIERTSAALHTVPWTQAQDWLIKAFERDGYTVMATRPLPAVLRPHEASVDFCLQRQGRTMLVSARKFKSARTGVDAITALQAARDAAANAPDGAGFDGPVDALIVCLGEFSDPAAKLATAQRIAVWRGPELALALRGFV